MTCSAGRPGRFSALTLALVIAIPLAAAATTHAPCDAFGTRPALADEAAVETAGDASLEAEVNESGESESLDVTATSGEPVTPAEPIEADQPAETGASVEPGTGTSEVTPIAPDAPEAPATSEASEAPEVTDGTAEATSPEAAEPADVPGTDAAPTSGESPAATTEADPADDASAAGAGDADAGNAGDAAGTEGDASAAAGDAGAIAEDASPAEVAGAAEVADAALAADEIAHGTWGTCAWTLTSDGTLTIGAGTGEDVTGFRGSPWYEHRTEIVSVTTTGKVTLPSNVWSLFEGCSDMTSFDASGFDVSRVTDMRALFNECSALKYLDLSSWDVSSVQNFSSMFRLCSSLERLDGISGWNTSAATSMSLMFYGCQKLQSIDVGAWNVSAVTSMGSMFNECRAITSLDLSGWKTSSNTSMWSMFQRCSSLKSLDLSGWDMSKVETAESLCHSCTSLTSVNLSGVTLPKNCSHMFDTCTKLESVNTTGLSTSQVTNMSAMFFYCPKLTSLDVSGWDTSSVTTMYGTFGICPKLADLDVSKWNTSQVTDMRLLFANCDSLTSLDLSGWDTSSVTKMSEMFDANNMASLTEVSVGAGFGFRDGMTLPALEVNGHTDWYSTRDHEWFTAEQIASNRSGIADTYNKLGPISLSKAEVTLPEETYPHTGEPIEPTPRVVLDGHELKAGTDYTVSYASNIAKGTATVKVVGAGNYTGEASTSFEIVRGYEVVAEGLWGTCPWDISVDGILRIDSGKGANLGAAELVPWRDSLALIKGVELAPGVVLPEYLGYMFCDCSALTSLDASGWDVSGVRDVSRMFDNCTALESLSLSGWDMSNVSSRDRLFEDCTNLASLDLSGVYLPEDSSGFLTSLWSLADVNLSGIHTSNVRYMGAFFAGCSSLTSLDLTDWDVSNVEVMASMFIACHSLTSLDLSGWDVSNVYDMGYMFVNCEKLVTLNIAGWKTSSLMAANIIFNECQSLVSLDLSGWDTSKVTSSSSSLFQGCTSLSEVRVGEGFKFTPSITLPKDKVNGHTDWFSVTDQKWYTAAEIVASRSNKADTYTKTEVADLAKASVTLPQTSYTHTGKPITPAPSVKLGGKTLAAGTDYVVSYAGNTAVGTATVTVTAVAGSGYAGKASATFTIKAAPKPEPPAAKVDLAKATVTVSPATLTYDGTARRPKVTVKVGGKNLKEGADYAVAWTGGPTFGKLTAKVTGKGGYTGSKTATARINFTDTPVDAWYQEQGWLDYVVNGGVMTGIKDARGFTGAFAPEATVTRAQVAVVLFRFANPGNDATSNPAHYGKVSRFHDVPAGQWHTAAIEWCAQEGIVTGYGTTGNFGPDDPVTREQLATMMYRFATGQGAPRSAPASALSKAPDSGAVSGWSRDAMAWCAANKVITGYVQDGRIDPQGSATRAQLAKIITVVTRDVL